MQTINANEFNNLYIEEDYNMDVENNNFISEEVSNKRCSLNNNNNNESFEMNSKIYKNTD